MNQKMIQTGYLLGISLLLTSILYFFASNWQYFERITKILLALLLVVLFYAVHLSLERWVTWQPFLSNWALIAASIVFGIAVALVGQTYNSHADSYELFLVWLIPVLILAIMTRYVPFYVLSYILSQLTMLLFIFPSTLFMDRHGNELLLMLLGMIIFNACLFIIFYRKILTSKTILYMTYLMFLALWFYVAANDMLPFHIGLNFAFIFLLAVTGYYWFKQDSNKGLLAITVFFAAAFFLFRTFYWVFQHYGDFMLYILLFLAIGITLLGGIIVGILNRNKMNRLLVNVLTISITAVTTLFAVVAISGIFFLIFQSESADILYFFALIALITPALFVGMPAQFRYSLLGTGFLLAFFTAITTDQIVYQMILLVPLLIGVYNIKLPGVKLLAYLFSNIVLGYLLFDLASNHIMFIVLFCLNTSYYLLIIKEKATNYAAFLIASISFFGLTMLHTAFFLMIFYNGIFLFGIPVLLFLLNKNGLKSEWAVLLILWFVFLGDKYYEFLWTLLHKSIIALMLGLIFLGAAYLFDRPNKVIAPAGSVITYKKPFLIGLIVLQLGFVGFQAYTSEKLLTEGTEIKLALEPVDPRSMLQGDYIALNYKINQIGEDNVNGKVKVVLREDDGVYRYAGFYQKNNAWNQTYEKQPGDVIINGNANGYNQVYYGIETFFIPEGSGHELESKIQYAYVRVGKSGNAIIEDIE